jgi:hypothetical protein
MVWDLEFRICRWVLDLKYDQLTYIGFSEDNRTVCMGIDGKNTMIYTFDIQKKVLYRFFAGNGKISDIFMTEGKKFTISVHDGFYYKVFCF